MIDAGMSVEFNKDGIKVIKNGNLVFEGVCEYNVPTVKFTLNSKVYTSAISNDAEYRLWHERLAHVSVGKFLEIKRDGLFEDSELIKNVQVKSSKLCEACINGKQSRLKFEKHKNKENIERPLFVIQSDVCGPITLSTIDNKNLYVVFIDQYTHYCVTYLITYKSDVFFVFKDFVAKSVAHFNLKMVNLYIDNGRE